MLTWHWDDPEVWSCVSRLGSGVVWISLEPGVTGAGLALEGLEPLSTEGVLQAGSMGVGLMTRATGVSLVQERP